MRVVVSRWRRSSFCLWLVFLFCAVQGIAAAAAAPLISTAVTVPKDTAGWPLWNAYAVHFLDPNGRVIDHGRDDCTTSEGQAYAMFFSLVANDRSRFDKLLAWTTDNLAHGDLTAHLPVWKWGHAADGSWRILDDNSAADADLWMSYTLIEAGRIWQEPRYRSLGMALAALIAAREVKDLPGLGPMLLPAASGFSMADGSILNPSYCPLPVLTGMAHTLPRGPWRAMAKNLPEFLRRSSVHGFAMDWVRYSDASEFAPAVLPGAAKGAAPEGSYDAIRVYLWAGVTPRSMSGARAVLHAVPGMHVYLESHPIPPRVVNSAGTVTVEDGGVGFSAAVVPYLAAWRAQAQQAQQQNRLMALFDARSGLYGAPPLYYDQNLTLFAQGWEEKRYMFSPNGQLELPWNGAHSGARKDASTHGTETSPSPAKGESRK